jgi:hypothetical protein
MLVSASQVGRLWAMFDSAIATPAKPASSRIVRNALPTMPFESPISTQTTHTSAAAIRAPIATQIVARRILLDCGELVGSVMSLPFVGHPAVPPSCHGVGPRGERRPGKAPHLRGLSVGGE